MHHQDEDQNKDKYTSATKAKEKYARALYHRIPDIMRQWEKQVRELMPDVTAGLSSEDLQDHLEDFLKNLVTNIADDHHKLSEAFVWVENYHVEHRVSGTKFTLSHVLHEYIILRDVILAYLQKLDGVETSVHSIIQTALDQVMMRASDRYVETKQKLQSIAQKDIQNSYDRFNIALRAVPLAVFEKDRNLRFTWAYSHAFGFEAETIIGKTQGELLSKEQTRKLEEKERHLLRTGDTFHTEIKMQIGAREVFLAIVADPLRNNENDIVGLIASALDITEYRGIQSTLETKQQELEFILDNMQTGVLLAERPSGKVLYTNHLMEKMFGRAFNSTQEIVDLEHHSATYADEAAPATGEHPICRVIASGENIFNHEFQYHRSDGSIATLSVNAGTIETLETQISHAILVFNDVTKLKQTQNALIREKELADVTLRSIGEGVITTDAHGVITQLNPAAATFTGWAEHEAQGKTLTTVYQTYDERDLQAIDSIVLKCLELKERIDFDLPVRLRDKQGRMLRSVAESASPIHDQEGEVVGAALVFHDRSSEQNMMQEITYQATHDALTGLVNRREFERRLQRTIVASQQGGAPAALLYLDLDRFKIINDTCGHGSGDELLRRLSILFADHIRDRDTLGRLGGDEFGVILEHCSVKKAIRVANSIRIAMEEFHFYCAGRTFNVGVSIGLIAIDDLTTSLADAVAQADHACYIAKERGRNRVQVVSAEDLSFAEHQRTLSWVYQIKQATHQNRFKLYWQPIVPLSDANNHQDHYEVLLRMVNNAGKIETPDKFITIAERYDLMPQLDYWVVDHTLQWLQQNSMQTSNIAFCTINLSARTIGDEEAQQRLLALLDSSIVEPSKICFEITETTAVSSLPKASQFIKALKSRAYQFALDDFGTGMASFTYLKQLPVDYLKIDGSFIEHLVENRDDLAIVRAINEVGHIMGMLTIAEYVGSAATQEKLRALGVDFAQGFYIGQPSPMPDNQANTNDNKRSPSPR